ncbi:hypothetical protein [[Phormidium] sp. ETS-05]|uniref:hypothetical protein n=1 Tax=[Phormidium] sp. ETS-05 TaxID=222819 RepID=UPI0018EEFDAF|nr:hypothetical protein [[Phormidium] sp. ETS-05]
MYISTATAPTDTENSHKSNSQQVKRFSQKRKCSRFCQSERDEQRESSHIAAIVAMWWLSPRSSISSLRSGRTLYRPGGSAKRSPPPRINPEAENSLIHLYSIFVGG